MAKASTRAWAELYNTASDGTTLSDGVETVLAFDAFRRGGDALFAATGGLDGIVMPSTVTYFRQTTQGNAVTATKAVYMRTATADGLYAIQEFGIDSHKFSFMGPPSPASGVTAQCRAFESGVGSVTVNTVTPYGGVFVEDMSNDRFCVLRGPIGSSQSLSAATTTKVDLPNIYCQNGNLDFLAGGSPPSGHFVIPDGVSLVEISCGTPLTTATTARHIGGQIAINGTAVSYMASDNATSTGSALCSSIITPVTAGDVIEFQVRSESAETLGNGGSVAPWGAIVDLTNVFAAAA